ncbi:Mob1/phocein [Infundibulicybe gibba]|nr:Mob1/phocein [Infundibulicybe gibba]
MSFFGVTHRELQSQSPSLKAIPDPHAQGFCRDTRGAPHFADAALVKGNFKTIVVLPKYVDVLEWVALNIFDFYTNLNEFYGVITECCTQQTCPTMSAGPAYVLFIRLVDVLWMGRDGKTSTLSAPMYIDGVMAGIQALVEDENQFPTKSAAAQARASRRTFRIQYASPTASSCACFAHIYHAHYPQILHLRSEPHFNSLFAHFLAFGTAYELLEYKDIKGEPNAPVGVGFVWERWKNAGILEG